MTSLYVYLFVLTSCLAVSLWYFRYQTGTFRWLPILLIITWIVELAGLYAILNKVNVNWVFHVFQPVEYTLLVLFYYNYFKQTAVRRWLLVSAVVFAAFCVVNVVYIQPLDRINTYSFSLEAALLVGWSIYFFYQLYTQEEVAGLFELPEFWVSTGILFFYTGAFALMTSLGYLMRTAPTLVDSLFLINRLLNCLLYGLYAVGIVCKVQLVKSSSLS